MRVLIAYEDSHGLYAEALRSAIRGHRPGAEVAACGIAELGTGVEGFDTDLVVSSRPTPRNRVGGRRRGPKNPGVGELLAVVDETRELVRSGHDLGCCLDAAARSASANGSRAPAVYFPKLNSPEGRTGAAMGRGEFVAVGKMEVGPTARFFVFLEGDYLGKRLVDHFGLPEEKGYTDLGRVRVTVERLEGPEA